MAPQKFTQTRRCMHVHCQAASIEINEPSYNYLIEGGSRRIELLRTEGGSLFHALGVYFVSVQQ